MVSYLSAGIYPNSPSVITNPCHATYPAVKTLRGCTEGHPESIWRSQALLGNAKSSFKILAHWKCEKDDYVCHFSSWNDVQEFIEAWSLPEHCQHPSYKINSPTPPLHHTLSSMYENQILRCQETIHNQLTHDLKIHIWLAQCGLQLWVLLVN